MTDPIIFGLELGGTKCLVLRAIGRTILDRISIPTTTPDATLYAVDQLFDRWQRQRRPDAVGIASFGPVAVNRRHSDWGFVLRTPKAGWAGTDLVGRYRRLLGVEIGFDTDVNAAALAEYRWGDAFGTSCNAYITLGTGVGVGLIVNGKPLHGWLHPEFGHLRARRLAGDKFKGACPFHGDCIEGLVSGVALAARSGVRGEELADDNPVWDAVAHDIGELIASLILAVSPEKIALGGGIACARPWLAVRTRRAIITSLGNYIEDLPNKIDTIVGIAALGAEAGPLGAIALGLTALEAAGS